jgi:hypothetical protein
VEATICSPARGSVVDATKTMLLALWRGVRD